MAAQPEGGLAAHDRKGAGPMAVELTLRTDAAQQLTVSLAGQPLAGLPGLPAL